MRITVELIQKSPQYINPLRERELCLRGLKIPALENLGATLVLFTLGSIRLYRSHQQRDHQIRRDSSPS